MLVAYWAFDVNHNFEDVLIVGLEGDETTIDMLLVELEMFLNWEGVVIL